LFGGNEILLKFFTNCDVHQLNTQKYYTFTGGEINGPRRDRIRNVDQTRSYYGISIVISMITFENVIRTTRLACWPLVIFSPPTKGSPRHAGCLANRHVGAHCQTAILPPFLSLLVPSITISGLHWETQTLFSSIENYKYYPSD
jgi:hypothetical protein